MCSKMGRWLRAAGYDTLIVETPLKDLEIYQKAVAENCLLLTCDRDFNQLDPQGKTVLYLKGNTLDEWAAQLKNKGIDWLFSPFSRCLQCNGLLEKVGKKSLQYVPEGVTDVWTCPHCKQLFWLGSHTQHMEEQLRRWQSC